MLTTLFFKSFGGAKTKQKNNCAQRQPMHNAEALSNFVLFKSLLKFVVADKTVPQFPHCAWPLNVNHQRKKRLKQRTD
jgi:hypothetical protein